MQKKKKRYLFLFIHMVTQTLKKHKCLLVGQKHVVRHTKIDNKSRNTHTPAWLSLDTGYHFCIVHKEARTFNTSAI